MSDSLECGKLGCWDGQHSVGVEVSDVEIKYDVAGVEVGC